MRIYGFARSTIIPHVPWAASHQAAAR